MNYKFYIYSEGAVWDCSTAKFSASRQAHVPYISFLFATLQESKIYCCREDNEILYVPRNWIFI